MTIKSYLFHLLYMAVISIHFKMKKGKVEKYDMHVSCFLSNMYNYQG